jgi:hypothetical protein
MARFDAIFKNLPKKAVRSRLEPYGRLIKGLLRRGKTYREIAHLLAENCGVRVSVSTIHDFVRVRSLGSHDGVKRRTVAPQPAATPAPPGGRKIFGQDQPTPDVVYQRIEDFKRRPAQIQQTPELFHYDPNEPLHIPEKRLRKKPGE